MKHLNIDEIIIAVREQRGGVLPLRALLECRLAGVQVTDLPRFFERVHGRVPIESLKVSWLIYGNGFRQNWLRGVVKRAFDIVVAVVLLLIVLPLMAAIVCLISLDGGAPIIYRQERVGCRGQRFTLLKFRSMTQDAEKNGQASWADINDPRVTAVGRFMRRTRVDELPQGVRKGDATTYAQVMSMWEQLHAPFLAAADMQVDPIQKIEAYRKTQRVDYGCELAHQKAADVARELAREKRFRAV